MMYMPVYRFFVIFCYDQNCSLKIYIYRCGSTYGALLIHLRYSLSLLPWLLSRPPKLAPPARIPIHAPTARNTVRTVDLLGSV
jgi:hypothetical protein